VAAGTGHVHVRVTISAAPAGADGRAAGQHDAGCAPARRLPGELGGQLSGVTELGDGGVRGVMVAEPAREVMLACLGQPVGDLSRADSCGLRPR
jgi:hypothetical protein